MLKKSKKRLTHEFFSAGGNEFLETVGRLGRFQRFRPKSSFLAAEYTAGNVRRAVRSTNVKRGRGTTGTTVVGDLLDGTHVDHPYKAENVPA